MIPSMSPDQWDVAWQLFYAAAELPPNERRSFLDTASNDPVVVLQVLALLDDSDKEADPPQAVTRSHTQVSHYFVGKCIGRGGMGEVYEAHDTKLDRTVALKFLNPRELGADSVKRLIREAKTASGLNHPNIVTVHEVIESESELAIVMELVDGVALRSILGAPLPLPKLVSIGRQIVEALAAAHARGIIHRDIKPENVMLREDGYVKLLDFGLARRTDTGQSSNRGIAAGTLLYMSPEQARGDKVRAGTDIFSLGVVFYECATGQHPFGGDSPFETGHRILTADPPSPATLRLGFPPELERLVLAMLSKDPLARPSAQTVLLQLKSFLAQQSSIRNSQSEIHAPKRGKKRWIIAASVLMLCGLAAWYWQKHTFKPAITLRQITTQIPENQVTAAAISSDGQRLAYATVDGIFLRILSTGETQQLRAPVNFLVDKLTWFSDGVRLAAGGFFANTHKPAIWSVSLLNAVPRLLREEARLPEPSPDGTKLAFTNSDRTEIWIAGMGGEDGKRLVSSQSQDRFSVLLWSADGSSLRYQRQPYDPRQPEAGPLINTQQRTSEHTYESVDVKTGRELFRVPDMSIYSAAALPDGRVLCLRPFIKHPDWHFELWKLETDTRTGRLRQAQRRASIPHQTWCSNLSATADGKRMVMLRPSSSYSIYIGDYSSGEPRITNIRRLTLDSSSSFPHAWTPDSLSVIFESDRGMKNDLFRQNINSRIAETILATPQDEVFAVLAPGGKWLLFTQGVSSIYGINTEANPLRLMRMPVDGGTPEPVPIGGPLQEYACAAPGGKRCVLRISKPGDFYIYHELDPIYGKGRELARTRWTQSIYGDWAVSPDGTEVALPVHDSPEAKVRIVSLKGGPEREIVLKGFKNINGLNWTTDGKGWFVAFNTTVGLQLMYVDRNGRAIHLLDGWYALPSPDGQKVALVIPSVASNAWMYEGLNGYD